MVDLPHGVGISFRNFCKSYKSFFKKWHSKVIHSKKDGDHVDDPLKHHAFHSKDGEEGKKEGSRARARAIKGGERLRYGGGRSMRENEPTSSRHRSYDGGFSSLSRNASQRGQNPSSSESVTSRVNSGWRSMDSISSNSTLLSKNGSRRRSTTPIMFSNSSGVLKPAPIEKELECTLEELCFGCMKKIKVTRDVFSNTGQATQEEEILGIKVKPGWTKGTKITFEGMWNERPGSYPADVSFVIAEKRHSCFKREGDDLELTLKIPLIKALADCTISVPLLGGATMSLEINDVVLPGYEKIIEGQGMSKPKGDGKRGNLKVQFLVQFPTELTNQQRFDVCRILDGCEYYS